MKNKDIKTDNSCELVELLNRTNNLLTILIILVVVGLVLGAIWHHESYDMMFKGIDAIFFRMGEMRVF